jgi:predicted DNA-binding protein with PD1-like motif
MTVTTSTARHLLIRFTQPARLPEAILAALRDEVVLAGWMRASGVLSEVQIRTIPAGGGGPATIRRISGPVQVVALEGSIGLAGGDVSCGLRAVLARETNAGLETFSGDLVDARIEALEVLVTAFDDVTATRQLDPAGVWVLEASEGAARPAPAAIAPVVISAPIARSEPAALPTAQTMAAPPPNNPAPVPSPMPPPATLQSGFAEVVRAAEPVRVAAPPAPPPPAPEPVRPKPSTTFSGSSGAMPQRIARPVEAETEDDPVPEPGDTVDHFAFGRCEVVKTDGDRLHVRLGKDQRIKEIALEMLKVTPLPDAEGAATTSRHWKLARKL